MTQTLPKLPDARPLLLKALKTISRKADASAKIPPLSVKVSGVRADAKLVDRYRDVCGFAPSDVMPITYPQVLVTSLHLWLMTQPEFPFALLGLVHLRNKIEQAHGLPVDGVYDVVASVGPARRIPNGIIFDLITEFTDASGEVVYKSVTTPLVRLKTDMPKGKMPEPVLSGLADYKSVSAPADTGRRYAQVSQDYNPIHLYPITARLFGFKQAIAHGMWTVARCAALLEGDLGGAPKELQVQYRAPVMLPTKAVVKRSVTTKGHEFLMLAANKDRTYLSGLIR
ncbi:MaoC like domain-containing protein [Hydrocarboniphaga daqingensis]|jgi:acyl dehydratase|uniref:MaoC like domain-containing protein n=1 Tax=Hydrocarboniphaga daqingensis TaxID=490188 RepID=A0A1M5RSF3_9GAMM|nr:MaoC/PaaZ C-terminal domain-containing protein [Hydrocarboniphaga daqingensis]SHH29214.1 MaoC like domain-containing protein [Hydrocarboniphaga daqingensis]